ncbi:MAG: Crp/Fnr family transcriptional regulator [Brevundimonas sp.]|uniref:Crp/Fnr family transcriptional regulator n=1 Tax=Brevundimonas sp. TaxID=1871086 RepID=UPI003918DE88
MRKLSHGACLTDDDVAALRNLTSTVRRVEARGDIVMEGTAPRCLTVVLDGWVCSYRDLENGKRQITSILLPGDLAEPFGILPSFADHSLGALTPVTLAQVSPAAIRAAARSSLAVEKALWWDLLVATAIERERVVSLGRRSASERLGHLVCELHLRLEMVGLADGLQFDFPLTQAELADVLGLSAVHVNRSLKDLRCRGLMSLHNRLVTIHALDDLREASYFDPNYLHTEGPGRFERPAEPGVGDRQLRNTR